MAFYKSCFGGQLKIKTLEETLNCDNVPSAMRQLVVEAVLKSSQLTIYGSDLSLGEGLRLGNRVSILVQVNDHMQLENYRAALSGESYNGLPTTTAIQKGERQSFTDKFGVHWILHY